MSHPLEDAANALRTRLRDRREAGPVVPGRHIVPGVWIAADTQTGRLAAETAPVPGALLGLAMRVEAPGRWLSLNCALAATSGATGTPAPAPVAPGSVLGLAAALSADAPMQLGVSIRSGHAGGHLDARFADRLEVGRDPMVSVALLPVTDATFPPELPAWRNLMLHLPFRDLQLTVYDLRLFVVPPDSVAGSLAEGAGGV